MRPSPVTMIKAYKDGPLLVRGPVRLVDEDGAEIEFRRLVIPLCRCGRSRTKPMCDGAHEAAAQRRGNACAGRDGKTQPSATVPLDTAHLP